MKKDNFKEGDIVVGDGKDVWEISRIGFRGKVNVISGNEALVEWTHYPSSKGPVEFVSISRSWISLGDLLKINRIDGI
jgi:hypothetical protein